MTLMPEIHDALARAVTTRPNRRRWWHPTRRAGLLAAGALTISGTAVAATADWRPVLGDDGRGHPHATRSSVPSDQLAALAVLRRPQTGRDRGADVEASLRLLTDNINGVHTDRIRVLRRNGDAVTLLVPIQRIGHGFPHAQSHVLCVTRLTKSTQPLVTPKNRHGQRRNVSLGGNASTCGDTQQLQTTGIGWANGRLVPDGVAEVVVRLRGNRHVKLPVHDNFYQFATSELLPAWNVRWLDTQGNTIAHSRSTR